MCSYFDTFIEAKDFIVANFAHKLESAKSQYDYAKDVLGNAKGLKEDAPQDTAEMA